MSTTIAITEQAFVSTHFSILTIPPILLGLYREKYGLQSVVVSYNPLNIPTSNSLSFSLQTRFTLIYIASQCCTFDCKDYPGGPLIRRRNVPPLDQSYASTCWPGSHIYPALIHQKYLTTAYELSKKTFQTVSKCPTVYSYKFLTIYS